MSDPRPHRRPDGWPTRADMQCWTPAEHAIAEVVSMVEQLGASPALTDAVTLLARARERVADHVEGNGGEAGGCVPLAGYRSPDAEPAEGEGVGASTRKGEGRNLPLTTPGDSPSVERAVLVRLRFPDEQTADQLQKWLLQRRAWMHTGFELNREVIDETGPDDTAARYRPGVLGWTIRGEELRA